MYTGSKVPPCVVSLPLSPLRGAKSLCSTLPGCLLLEVGLMIVMSRSQLFARFSSLFDVTVPVISNADEKSRSVDFKVNVSSKPMPSTHLVPFAGCGDHALAKAEQRKKTIFWICFHLAMQTLKVCTLSTCADIQKVRGRSPFKWR